jgi:MFS family permease
MKQKYLTTTLLLTDNSKMILMFMFNAAFGFFSSLNNFYLGGVVVTDTIGEEYVGFLSAVTSLVAALFSFILPQIMSRYGRNTTMAIGSSSWMIYVILLLLLSTSEAGTWQVLVPLYILAGLGRGTWEAVVKAVWLDFFGGDDVGAAFGGNSLTR